jgi:hypothetical protein
MSVAYNKLGRVMPIYRGETCHDAALEAHGAVGISDWRAEVMVHDQKRA